ncbi:serine hydrolase domain-containing protein [Algoriphagus aquimarinus]|uniref:CubicO group peptidase, beta-lactamase class C family n=1 Tax=Algoriphagus aquimarinus TaxID=237018 RepID=A0A1I0X9S9_9BACT|nr:serine hydrolase domain-containing protein [Algoriphagus aquimarinus]SFA97090.1 CubicO group peptidase, beta-lactamase class C family [Algoriphagus aquimarinus]|tara:strand:+ start:20386 stop:21609 length:1224 start_codon:yes stop_codon:yes gene_type:complete
MFKNQLRLLFIAFLFLANGALAQTLHHEKTKLSTERLERYDSYLQNEVDQGRIAGAVSLIFSNGEKAHEKTIGYSNIESKSAMKLDQIFYIQSMTKPIITTAFMMLYEEGYFLLNDPLSKYIPEFKDAMVAKDAKLGTAGGLEPVASPIRIHQLMSHTAGLSHGLGQSEVDKEVIKGIYYTAHADIESRVKTYAGLPLYAQPGERWYYSAAPDILARLIEVFSGMTVEEFLQKRLLDPLGMPDTRYNLNEEQASRMATLHSYDETGKLIVAPRQTPTTGNKIFAGANGLFSTAQDYARFALMMSNGGELDGKRYLSPKTVEIMTINQIGDIKREAGHGFGFGFGVMTDLADAKSLGSEGTYYWSGAYCTYFFIDPKENLISILMTQTAPFSGFYEQKMRQLVYQAIE